MGFWTKLFKGSEETEKNGADEYTAYLLAELERARNEHEEAMEKERGRIAELEQEVAKEKEENEKLSGALKQQDERSSEKNGENRKQIEELQERLSEYESSYRDVSKYLSIAKKDADSLVSSAKIQSEKILFDAKEDADKIITESKYESEEYRRNVEKDLMKRQREQEEKFTVAKYQLKEYLKAFNRVQSDLIENYNELGKLIEKMPIRLEDVFSEEPFELLFSHEDRQKEEDGKS